MNRLWLTVLVPLAGCNIVNLFEVAVAPGSPPLGFDLALLGTDPYDFTGYDLAAGDLDGVPGAELAVLSARTSGDPVVHIWNGVWSGALALDQDAYASFKGNGLLSVAVGDFDGDGQADLALGNPEGGTNAKGEVRIELGPISAGAHGLLVSDGTWTGADDQRVGTSLQSLGDWDGDGIDDLLVGADDTSAVVFAMGPLNDSGDLASFPDRIVAAPGENWFNGPSAATGDLNGDGTPDLALGAELSGKVYLFFHHPVGEELSTDADVILLGDDPATGSISSYLGAGVAIGDVNGDGLDDLVVGEPFPKAGHGVVRVFHGPIDETVTLADADYTIEGGGGEAIGAFLQIAGDVDSDGVVELVLPDWNPIGAATSQMWLTDATGTGVVNLGTADTEELDTAQGDGLGMYGGVVGDVDFDADGLADVAIGAPNASGLSSQSGGVYVRRGSF